MGPHPPPSLPHMDPFKFEFNSCNTEHLSRFGGQEPPEVGFLEILVALAS